MTLSSNSDFAKLCLGIPHNIEHVSELLSTDLSRGDKAQILDISGDISLSCQKNGVFDCEVRQGIRTPPNVTASFHHKTYDANSRMK